MILHRADCDLELVGDLLVVQPLARETNTRKLLMCQIKGKWVVWHSLIVNRPRLQRNP